jgi:GGDEF domain-containing protein
MPTVRAVCVVTASNHHHRDRLTGFRDHHLLVADLGIALGFEHRRTVLAIFGLVGLDTYRDVEGDIAADIVMASCAVRFAHEVGRDGVCYRPRQDELAVLSMERPDAMSTILPAIAEALPRKRDCPSIAVCFGAATLPDEASEPVELLTLADHRLRARIDGSEPTGAVPNEHR